MLLTYNIRPIPDLRPFVNNIWVVDAKNLNHAQIEKMIPYGCMDFVFVEKPEINYISNTLGKQKIGQFFVSGQITKPYYLEYSSGAKMIGFGFFPHTGHLFTGVSSHELTNGLIDFSDLYPDKDFDRIKDELVSTHIFQEKLMLLQAFVVKKIRKNLIQFDKQDYAHFAIQKILKNKGQLDLHEVAGQLNVSKRSVQLLFKDRIGVSPIHFSKIIRFLNALELLNKKEFSLTEQGFILGYYDQSHFIRDFKRFSGTSPKQYLKEQHYLLDEFTQSNNHSFLYNSL